MNGMKDGYFNLLKAWCDGLMGRMVNGTGIEALDGGLYCEACAGVHGRSADAVYPLMYIADATGDTAYLEAAKALQRWSGALVCEDGSVYNDHNSAWNGITVFAAIALYNALHFHGHLLDADTRLEWEVRLRGMSVWLYKNITSGFVTNINYLATNAAAMALLGYYLDKPEYHARARELYEKCAVYIGADGLLVGEGRPMGHVTPRGCRAVDIGYNVEESLPMLALYAHTMKDEDALRAVTASIHGHLRFMLPDGAWDNSFGTRNFKWTYWGGRTSDGFQEAAAALPDDPVIARAAQLNVELYAQSTHGGLLYGGPHLFEHGEKPCLHHTICHAKALASVLDADVPEPPHGVSLPEAPVLAYYKEIDTYKAHVGGYCATVTGYDFDYMRGGHASGGTLTLLWHEKTGPLIASSMTDYSMAEPNNMQLTLKPLSHRNLTPGVRLSSCGSQYAQYNDTASFISASECGGSVVISVRASLCDMDGRPEPRGARCEAEYRLTEEGLTIRGRVDRCEGDARFVLPLIGKTGDGYTMRDEHTLVYPAGNARLTVHSHAALEAPEPIFFLPGGFEAWEIVITPDADGVFEVLIAVG